MKIILVLALIILNSLTLWAQLPDKMTYQAVVRDADGILISEQTVGVRLSILYGGTNGESVYSEELKIKTNANGLISFLFGGQVGWTEIDWSLGDYYIKTEVAPPGEEVYSLVTSMAFTTVPYALHSGSTVESDPMFSASQAANITEAHIESLSSMSGVNTGDQDMSGIDANAQAIIDTAYNLRAIFLSTNSGSMPMIDANTEKIKAETVRAKTMEEIIFDKMYLDSMYLTNLVEKYKTLVAIEQLRAEGVEASLDFARFLDSVSFQNQIDNQLVLINDSIQSLRSGVIVDIDNDISILNTNINNVSVDLDVEKARTREIEDLLWGKIYSDSILLHGLIAANTSARQSMLVDINNEISNEITIVNTNISNASASSHADLDVEIARARRVEDLLWGKLYSDSTFLHGLILANASARQSMLVDINNEISNEISIVNTNISNASASSHADLDVEIARARGVEDLLWGKIRSDSTFLHGLILANASARQTMLVDINNEISNEISIVNTNISNASASSHAELDVEIARAKSAEENLEGKIDEISVFVKDTINNIIYENESEYLFILGGRQLAYDEENVQDVGGEIVESKFVFVPQKAAFRIGAGQKFGLTFNEAYIGLFSTVSGGLENQAAGAYAVIGGGDSNEAYGEFSAIIGGEDNQASSDHSTVAGGEDNHAVATHASVLGGEDNHATKEYASIVGGEDNLAEGDYAFVGGGLSNEVKKQYGVIAGGIDNTVSGDYGFVGGGEDNEVLASYSSILGGVGNVTSNFGETVVGYYNDTVTVALDASNYRIFSVGNGDNQSRSNALKIYKDGTATTSGVWTGPGFSSPSDERLKKDIHTLTNILEKLEGIRGVSYAWREDIEDGNQVTGRDIGVVAQELNTVFPELVYTDANGYLSVDYPKLSAILLQAVKEQQNQLDRMQGQIDLILEAMNK